MEIERNCTGEGQNLAPLFISEFIQFLQLSGLKQGDDHQLAHLTTLRSNCLPASCARQLQSRLTECLNYPRWVQTQFNIVELKPVAKLQDFEQIDEWDDQLIKIEAELAFRVDYKWVEKKNKGCKRKLEKRRKGEDEEWVWKENGGKQEGLGMSIDMGKVNGTSWSQQ